MSKIWVNEIGLLVDDVGVIVCDVCPCDASASVEPPVVPPDGWCENEEDPICPSYPILTDIPSMVDWTQSFSHSAFASFVVTSRRVVAESVTTNADAKQCSGGVVFEMRLPYLYVTRLQISMSVLAERLTGTKNSFRTIHRISSHQLLPHVRMVRDFNVTSGVSATRTCSVDYYTDPGGPDASCGPISRNLGADGSPYRILYDFPTPITPSSEDGNFDCGYVSPCCLRFLYDMTHIQPATGGTVGRFRTTADFTFSIVGSNTPP